MTKKELILLLQMVYANIPPCTCYIGYQERGQIDPNCHRHAIFTEYQVNYIRISVENIAVKLKAVELPVL